MGSTVFRTDADAVVEAAGALRAQRPQLAARLDALARRLYEREPKRYALTAAQMRVFRFITDYIATFGTSPTQAEIAQGLNFRSLATVNEHIGNLQRKGYVQVTYNAARGITLAGAA